MLRVKTYIKTAYRDQKPIGFGLFAAEPIKKDTIIWKLDQELDVVLDKKDWPEPINSFLKTYAYREGYRIILCSDNARYINHSFEPNLIDWVDQNGSWTAANKDIQQDEELTSNYKNFDDDPLNENYI